MPDEDGYSLLRTIRALPEAEGGRIPAVALTAATFAGWNDYDRKIACESLNNIWTAAIAWDISGSTPLPSPPPAPS